MDDDDDGVPIGSSAACFVFVCQRAAVASHLCHNIIPLFFIPTTGVKARSAPRLENYCGTVTTSK